MLIHAEVDENGMIKVSDPALKGKKILLSIPEQTSEKPEEKTNWDELWKIFKEADKLDIPRKTPEEILKELREFRETD